MDCYCISGLGADQRIFSRLDLPGVSLTHLAWLIPEAAESIAAYADRMRSRIPGDNPVLIGVSFGGMMAIEIAKFYPAATVILVSSIRDHGQRQGWMTLGKLLHFDRWLSKKNVRPRTIARRWLDRFENYYLGVESESDASLVAEFREHTDRGYLRWSVARILEWENNWTPARLFHLQGGRDRIFPLSRDAVTHYVPDGGHLMIYNRAAVVSRLLAAILEKAH